MVESTPRPALLSAKTKLRHRLIIASIAVVMLLPSLLVAAYLWVVAADQYHSSMRFSIKSSEQVPDLNFLSGLTQISTPGTEDLAVLEDFIKSSAMVSALERQLDIAQIYRRPDFDPVFAYQGPDRVADFTKYWNRMVDVVVYRDRSIMSVRVLAFDPDDAQQISTIILAESQRLVADLSNIARDDAIRSATQERDIAASRLREIRQELFVFRNRYQITDPELDLTNQMAVIAELSQLKTELLIEISLLGEAETTQSQRRDALSRRLATIDRRIEAERARLGQGSSFNAADENSDFSTLIGRFEELSTELEIAQQNYLSAQQAYDLALAEADRRSRYLVAHIPPTRAETPLSPRKDLILIITILLTGLVWSVAVLVYYSIRERQ